MASLDNFANPFSSNTFLTSTPSAETIYPFKLYFDEGEIVTETYLCKKNDYRTDLIARALFFD